MFCICFIIIIDLILLILDLLIFALKSVNVQKYHGKFLQICTDEIPGEY
jgi:hypothetical protein